MTKEYKVVQVALPVGYAHYPRPAVVICIVAGTRKVVAVSSKLGLFRSGQHFLIRDDHPDFPKTGLSDTSYAIGDPIFDVEKSEIIKEMGVLSGDLAKEFARWID
jgi:hypothetical protein